MKSTKEKLIEKQIKQWTPILTMVVQHFQKTYISDYKKWGTKDVEHWIKMNSSLFPVFEPDLKDLESSPDDKPSDQKQLAEKIIKELGFWDSNTDNGMMIKAMVEFASQVQSQEVITENDIKKWAQKTKTSKIGINWSLTEDIRYREGLEDGALLLLQNKIPKSNH